MKKLLSDIYSCTVCEPDLPLGANPIVIASPKTKIALISQAPGRIAHFSGVPWDDPGGKELKRWLQVSEEVFYDPKNFGIVPMGFCYPGKGKRGDLPPRPECAPLWHEKLFSNMPNRKVSILIGQYAQKAYLKKYKKKNLTETVRSYNEYLPTYFPLPHPSPINRFWRIKNPWFEDQVLPELRIIIHNILENK